MTERHNIDVMATPDYKGMKLFGRKWKVSVFTPINETVDDGWGSFSVPSQSEWTEHVLSDSQREDLSLRVTFNIQKYGWVTPNYSEITVYNLSPNLEKLVIENGHRVVVQAGYVNGEYGIVYDSPILQPLWERENVTDFKLTLRCIDTDKLMYENHVEVTAGALQYQKDMILYMMSKARKPVSKVYISDDIKSNKLPRAKTFFGEPKDYLRDFARQSGTHVSFLDNTVSISRVQSDVNSTVEALVLSPGVGGLIGTPQQTQDGITFNSLLNPALRILRPQPMLAKIDNKTIKQIKIAQGVPFSRLDEEGIYKIIGITHIGDTRGNDWYSNVIGCNQSMEGLLAAQYSTFNDVSK